MLSSRKKIILKSIIEIYSQELKPISSKLLTSLPYLNCSSATIRSEMFELQNQGYLKKIYNSSGRIPSFKGYTYYLNNLITLDTEIIKTFDFIESKLKKNSFTKEKSIQTVLEILSNFTHYTSIAIGPDISTTSAINKIEFIPLNDLVATILVITNKGDVQYQNIVLNHQQEICIVDIQKVIQILNKLLKDKFLSEAQNIIQSDLVKDIISKYIKHQEILIEFFIETFSNFINNNCYLYGFSNVVNQLELNNKKSLRKIISLLTKKELVKVMTIKSQLLANFSDDIELIELDDFIIISISFFITSNEKGKIAILGPFAMKYQIIIPLLEYLSVYLSNLYKL